MIGRPSRCILGVLLTALGACSGATDAPAPVATPDSSESAGLMVSDAISQSGREAVAGGVSTSETASDVGAAAYVSLLPGTVPGGRNATITNRRTGAMTPVVVVDGGFDPIAVPAATNDVVDVVVYRENGGEAARLSAVVRRKRPRIVRTNPPRGATDVPLSSVVVVVFSEPMDAATVTDRSVRLSVDGQSVAASVRLIPQSNVSAELVPAAPLLPGTTYDLIVDGSLTNLAGDALDAAAAIPFATQASSRAAVYSVFVTPQGTGPLMPGGALQLLAVVQDADFNVLTDREVTWTSSNTILATVSATGFVLAGLSPGGTVVITAASEGKAGSATLSVAPVPTGRIAVVINTTGVDVDPDGYLLHYETFSPLSPTRINDSLTLNSVTAGEKQLWLADVDPNCVVDGDVRNVTAANGTTATARFTITCGVRPAFTDEGLSGVWEVEKFEFFRDSVRTSRISDFAAAPRAWKFRLILQRTPEGTFRWQWRWGEELPLYTGGHAAVIGDTLRTLSLDRWSANGECWDLCTPFDAGGEGVFKPSRHVISRSGDQLVFTRLEPTILQYYGSGAAWPRLTLRKVR